MFTVARFNMVIGGHNKSPKVFTDDAEKIQFRSVLLINTKIPSAEKS